MKNVLSALILIAGLTAHSKVDPSAQIEEGGHACQAWLKSEDPKSFASPTCRKSDWAKSKIKVKPEQKALSPCPSGDIDLSTVSDECLQWWKKMFLSERKTNTREASKSGSATR